MKEDKKKAALHQTAEDGSGANNCTSHEGKGRTIFEQYQIVSQMRALVFEAYASATKLMAMEDVVESTSLDLECVKSRTEELINEGRIWPCGTFTSTESGRTKKCFTTNPNVSFASCVFAVKEIFDLLSQQGYDQAQVDLLIAIREYVLHKNPTPQLLFDTDGQWMKVWKEVKEIIDEEVLYA